MLLTYMHVYLWLIIEALWHLMLLRFAVVLQEVMVFLLNIDSYSEMDMLSSYQYVSMHKLTVATNKSG